MKAPPNTPPETSLHRALGEIPAGAVDPLAHEYQAVISALLLGSAPPLKAPPAAWTGIQQHIAAGTLRLSRRRKIITVLQWSGWAAAACVALAWWQQNATGLGGHGSAGGNGRDLSGHPHSQNGSGAGSGTLGGSTAGAGQDSADSSDPAGSDHAAGHGMSPRLDGKVKDYALVQSMETLSQEVKMLRAAHAERFTASPGVARIVVMRMDEEGKAEGGLVMNDRPSAITSEKLSEFVATGIAKENDAKDNPGAPKGDQPKGTTDTDTKDTPPERRPISLRPGDTWNREFVIAAGDPMPDFTLINLPPGVSVRHGGLPLTDPQWQQNFQAIPDRPNEYYDVRDDIIWRPANDHPGEYRGSRPGAEFNKDNYTFTSPPPENPPNTEPVSPTDKAAQQGGAGAVTNQGTGTEPQPATTRAPNAWTIFDEATGKGTIILDSLPPAPPGTTYELTFRDTLLRRDVSAGFLPTLDNGRGPVSFDLGAPGYSPGNYSLSLRNNTTNLATPVLTGQGIK
jgi:hypothetical protein